MKNYSVLLGIFLSLFRNSIQAQVQVLEEELEIVVSDTFHDDTMPIDAKTLAIDDYKDETWRIFPNPAIDKIKIQEPSDWSESLYKIIDLHGKTVKTGLLQNQEINIDELKSGLYIVRISNGKGKILHKKIVKQ